MKTYWSEELGGDVTIPDNEPQAVQEFCSNCKPFKKYAATRLVKQGERVCSVCGKKLN